VNVCKTGLQRPSLLLEPPEAVDWTLADIAVEFAEACGYVLDEWQRWLVRWAFVRRPDGLWSARDFGMEVPRQNGKNVVLEVIELAAILLFGDRLVTHSAHRADTSAEHFRSLKERIESTDELLQHMPSTPNGGFQTANGKEQIEFKNGARLLFKARQNSSGRGPRPQRIVFDEALVLEHSQIGSMAPGIVAQRNPQLIFASSPPRSTSPVLHGLRARALTPDPSDRLFYGAWNNPPGTSVDDRDAWYRVNPSLGYGRMTEDSLQANRKLMSADEYLREHIGVPEAPMDGGEAWPPGVWERVVAAGVAPAGRLCLAVDASPFEPGKQQTCAIGVAGGGVVELVEPRPSMASLAVDVVAAARSVGAAVALDPGGPAGFVRPALEAAGVEIVDVSGQKMGQACALFFDDVMGERLKVRRNGDLDRAVAGALVYKKGDAWVWARRQASADVSPLVAVTLAWWAAAQSVPSDEYDGSFVDLDDYV